MLTFRRTPVVRRTRRLLANLRLETCEDRTVPALAVGVNIPSFGSNFLPPIGNGGSVGPNHFVQFLVGEFAVFDKSGNLVAQQSDDSFWTAAGISSTVTSFGLGLPRVTYDVLTDRWFAMEINLANTSNQVLLGRSDSSDPTGTWKAINYTGIPSQFANFPTLALDANAVYVGTANFVNSMTPAPMGISFYSFPKADLLLATPSIANASAKNQPAPSAMGWAPAAATNFDPSADHASIVATNYTLFNKINLTTVTGTDAANATFGSTSVLSTFNTSLPGKSRQPDGTRQISGGDDDRYTGAVVQVGDLIYAAHGISVNSSGVAATSSGSTTNAIHLVVIRDSTDSVVAQGTYYNTGYDYIFPSVAANQYGDIVIGYNRSGGVSSTDGNLGAYAVYARIDPTGPTTPISFGPEIELQAGLANNYHQQGGSLEAWGPYTSTTLDPTYPLAFWTTQEFVQSDIQWGTQISQVFVSPRAVSVSSANPNGTYGAGAVIDLTLSFTGALNVTGTPHLALNSGGTAVYSAGSGTSTLTFTYTVGTGESTSDLDVASVNALTLNGGSIVEAFSGLDAELTMPTPGGVGSLGANKDFVIDAIGPTITGVGAPIANGTYGFGASIPITVAFTRPVTVTGTPQLALNSGGTANYTSGTGTNTLTFTYTVGAGQGSADLDYTSVNALTLNGGTIKDQSNAANATLTLPAPGAAGSLGANKDIVIDALPPKVTGVTSSVADGTYGFGAIISITITYDDAVNVTGSPQLALNSGGSAIYASGSGTTTLTFNYTVGGGQSSADLDYATTTSLTLNGGTITETSTGQNANLILPSPGAAGSLGANKNIVIQVVPPVVTNVTSPKPNGAYGIGASINITVQFNRSVVVTGSPLLALNSGGTAVYASGSGSVTLTFTYTVAGGQIAADLDYASTSALTLNGGTIQDASGLDANRTLPAPGGVGSLGANKNLIIDTAGPIVQEFRVLFGFKKYNVIGSTRFDMPWQVKGVQVLFNEPVYTGNVFSLGGLTATRFSGLKTKTLTWNFGPINKGSFNATLANSGSSALKDALGNPIDPFAQAFKVLFGDATGDGLVDNADEAEVRAHLSLPYHMTPSNYNLFADLSGDGIINLIDIGHARNRQGNSLP